MISGDLLRVGLFLFVIAPCAACDDLTLVPPPEASTDDVSTDDGGTDATDDGATDGAADDGADATAE